jgi:hypothetical protein
MTLELMQSGISLAPGPCGAVDGTTKWQTDTKNVQRPNDEQILTLKDFYELS